MRASWTGAIAFGLVSIPVRLFRAVEQRPMRFRYLHRECLAPLLTRRYCPVHEEVIPWHEVVRGYQVEPGRYIVVEEELEEARRGPQREHRIDIEAFVDLAEIDPLYFDTSYYAEPTPEARPAYAVLQQAMQQTARAGIARFALRGRERLAALRPRSGALVVQTLFYADEVGATTALSLPAEPTPPRELRTAIRLIESMAEPFAARPMTDEYHRRLMSLIEARAERMPVPAGAAAEAGDLLGTLQASLGTVQEARREAP